MKSMLKKLSVLLGVLLVALALTGCTPKKAEPTATPVAVATETPVVVETPEAVVETPEVAVTPAA
ncbi:MAG: hypothetical protein GX858_01040 [Clostridiales bacterium]|nr:hypothetical protein [Clostridiales bacterium]